MMPKIVLKKRLEMVFTAKKIRHKRVHPKLVLPCVLLLKKALVDLVGNGKVHFYMISRDGESGWRLIGNSISGWNFNREKKSVIPTDLFQLRGKNDVPDTFLRAGRKVLVDTRGPKYFVWLPSIINNQIKNIMSKRESGVIEINNFGNVSIK